MKVPFADLRAQYQSIKQEIDGAVQQVLNEAAFIGGKRVSAFEEAFAEYTGARFCVSCANGTDALEIALRAVGIGAGDEVLVPANTFVATAEAVSNVGARVVFVDSAADSYNIDVRKIEEKISPLTRAVIAVHLYGQPVELDELMAVTNRRGLLIIEDCAQAHGAEYKGRRVGTFGAAAAFSFFPGKNLGAYGDAGAIVTNRAETADRCRLIANHGGKVKYEHQIVGRNSRLDGLQAAVLLVKLRHIERWTECRRASAALYMSLLAGAGVVQFAVPDYLRHVYHLFVVEVPNRDLVRQALSGRGIETGIHYPCALPLLEAYRNLGHTPADFPIAAGKMHKILSMPMSAELARDQLEYAAAALVDAIKL